MRQIIIRALAVLTYLAMLTGLPLAANAKDLQVGDVAPEFQLTLINGTKVNSADLHGQVIVLNFWATWCGPCKRELPTLDAYYRGMGKYGLRVFAITTEDSAPLFALKKLFTAMAIPSVRRIKGPYSTLGGVPTNYVIDRSGHIRHAEAGAFELDDLNTLLVPLLREPIPETAGATK